MFLRLSCFGAFPDPRSFESFEGSLSLLEMFASGDWCVRSNDFIIRRHGLANISRNLVTLFKQHGYQHAPNSSCFLHTHPIFEAKLTMGFLFCQVGGIWTRQRSRRESALKMSLQDVNLTTFFLCQETTSPWTSATVRLASSMELSVVITSLRTLQTSPGCRWTFGLAWERLGHWLGDFCFSLCWIFHDFSNHEEW